MRAVVQRVRKGSVEASSKVLASIRQGLVVLLGVAKDDDKKDAFYMAEKIANLRIFSDKGGKLNYSVKDKSFEILVISQFTLLGDVRRGRRPSYDGAAPPDVAESLYKKVVEELKNEGLTTKEGRFGATMSVDIVNDGPVTVLLDSKKAF